MNCLFDDHPGCNLSRAWRASGKHASGKCSHFWSTRRSSERQISSPCNQLYIANMRSSTMYIIPSPEQHAQDPTTGGLASTQCLDSAAISRELLAMLQRCSHEQHHCSAMDKINALPGDQWNCGTYRLLAALVRSAQISFAANTTSSSSNGRI